MKDPENPKKPTPPPQEDMWAKTDGAENVHKLTDDSFDGFMKSNPSVLVMFYAPCMYYLLVIVYSIIWLWSFVLITPRAQTLLFGVEVPFLI